MNPTEIKDFIAMAEAIVGMDAFSSNLMTRIRGALHDTAGIARLLVGATAADQFTIRSHMRELAALGKLVAKVRKYTGRIIDAFPYRDSFPHLATFIDAHGKFFAWTAELVRRVTSLRASLYAQGWFFYSGPFVDASMKAFDLYVARFSEHYSAMTVALRSQRGLTHVRW